jgi:hypothetical protein
MLSIAITLLIVTVIAGLLYWAITYIPLPAPFAQVARAIIVIVYVIFVCVQLWALRGVIH